MVVVSMITIIVLILLSTLFTWLNKREIVKTTQLKLQAEEVKQRLDMVFTTTLRQIDLGLRGYALTKNVQLLDPLNSGIKGNEKNLLKLDSLLRVQKLDTSLAKFGLIKKGVADYIEFSLLMKKEAERDSMKTFVAMLNEDKGYDLWKIFGPFTKSHTAYEDVLIKQAQADYESALQRNLLIQFVLVLLGLPSIIFIIYRVYKEKKERHKLLFELEDNNRKFLFNPGTEFRANNLEDVIESSIGNFKNASQFIKGITSKNYNIEWGGLNQSNAAKNADSLAGDLIKMRDQMKIAKQEDEKRFWINEGLAQFSQLVRNNQTDLVKLAEEATSFLAKYLKAQQGSLFIINDENEDDRFLELVACFAFDKKKYLTKRIDIGNGLVGQTYLEGEPVVLKQIPPNYIHITSGLGLATPTCLCIIPLKYNTKTEAMLELASFHFFEPHQIDFLQKAGEFVASALVSAKVSTKMAVLLEQSQQQSEEMRAQEEEMRQNMEELQATQEQMNRTVAELGAFSSSLEKEKYLLDSLLDNIPDSIYFKDQQSKLMRVSQYLADRMSTTVEDLIGKSDFDFQDKAHAEKAFKDEREIMATLQPKIDYVERESETKWVSTTKMPLLDSKGKVVGTFGISRDISKIKNLELNIEDVKRKLVEEKERLQEKVNLLEQKVKTLEGKNQ
jgi:PAS domain S-box-containing protein